MSFRVSGKNLDVGEALRARINSRIGEAMSKYFDGGYSGHVTVAREGFGIPHRMRRSSRFQDHAARRGERARCLCERRRGGAAHGKAIAPLPSPAEGPSLLERIVLSARTHSRLKCQTKQRRGWPREVRRGVLSCTTCTRRSATNAREFPKTAARRKELPARLHTRALAAAELTAATAVIACPLTRLAALPMVRRR